MISPSQRRPLTEAVMLILAYAAIGYTFARAPHGTVRAGAVAVLVFALLILIVRHWSAIAWGGLRKPVWAEGLVGLFAMVPMAGLLVVWAALGLPQPEMVRVRGDAGAAILSVWLTCSSIFQEMLFRGLVLGTLLDRHGRTLAVIGSSLLFAAPHALPTLSIAALALYFLVGAAWAGLALWRNNIAAAVSGHLTWNLIALWLRVG